MLAALLFLTSLASAGEFDAAMPKIEFHKTADIRRTNAPPVFVSTYSTIYIYPSTENPAFKDPKNLAQLKKDVLAVYAGNVAAERWDGPGKNVVVLESAAEFKKALGSLRFADGIVELTDESLGQGPSFGMTYNYFYAKIHVGKTTKLGGTGTSSYGGQTIHFPELYNYSYGVAHEFLHQLVAKAGYLLEGKWSSYCPQEGHLNDGGLLNDAQDSLIWMEPSSHMKLKRPAKPGTGIEKIASFQYEKLGVAVFASEHGTRPERLERIMDYAGSTEYGFGR